mmetsp:Transcript_18029/g.41004  ORF Transcript_18029/g.41004 Transcript_18029/m.41004 type:complete len:96 (+) Transcript_18029:1745-2032(+)
MENLFNEKLLPILHLTDGSGTMQSGRGQGRCQNTFQMKPVRLHIFFINGSVTIANGTNDGVNRKVLTFDKGGVKDLFRDSKSSSSKQPKPYIKNP